MTGFWIRLGVLTLIIPTELAELIQLEKISCFSCSLYLLWKAPPRWLLKYFKFESSSNTSNTSIPPPIVLCSRFTWIKNSCDHRRVRLFGLSTNYKAVYLTNLLALLPSELDNYFVCKSFSVQTLLWLLWNSGTNKSWAPHHRKKILMQSSKYYFPTHSDQVKELSRCFD